MEKTQLRSQPFIPSFLVSSKQEFLQKLSFVRANYPCDHIHIDVCDNTFVKNNTWPTPGRITSLKLSLPFDVHLMIAKPERAATQWIACGARRVFIHIETLSNIACHLSPHIGLAINLETPIDDSTLLLARLNAILLMSVMPGWSGQTFHPKVIKKIKKLRSLKYSGVIAVDGGITKKNAARIFRAGADELIAASAVFKKYL